MLDFVENHEPLQPAQRQHRIGQTSDSAWVFEVEVRNRPLEGTSQGLGKRRFSYLARAQQSDHGKASKQTPDRPEMFQTLNHQDRRIP